MGKKSKKSFKKKHKNEKHHVDVTSLYQSGLTYFKDGDYHTATIEWTKIPDQQYPSEMRSQLAEACFRKGLQLYQQLQNSEPEKIFNQMIATITRATNLQPDKSIYHYHLGLVYHRCHNYKKAISAYRKAVEIEKNDRYLIHLILAYLQDDNASEVDTYWQLMHQKNEILATVISILNEQDISVHELNLTEDSTEHTFLAGLIHLQSKQYDLAKKIFEKTLSLISSQANKKTQSVLTAYIYYFLGLIDQITGKDKTQNYWEQLLSHKFAGAQMKRNLAIYFFNKGIKLAQNEKYMPAVAHLNNAQKMQPDNDIIIKNINLARFHYANQVAQQGDIEKAIKLWSLGPIKDDMNRIQNIALALDSLGQHKEANFQWTKILDHWKKKYQPGVENHLKEQLIIAHKHIAENYLKIGDEKRAIKEFEQVLLLTPNDMDMRNKMAELMMENGRWNGALREFNSILKLNPNDIDTMLNMAFIYDQMYEYDRGLDILFNILEIEPENGQAKKKIGEIYHEQAHEEWEEENYVEAIDLFQKQINLNPLEYHGYECLSRLYVEIGREKEITRLLNTFLKNDMKNPIAHIKAASTFFDIGAKAKANKHIKEAERLNPNDFRMLIEIGKIIFHVSSNRAKTYFDKALNLAPNEVGLYLDIGSWIGAHDPTMAIFYVKKYVQLVKDDVKAFVELGLLYGFLNKKKESDNAFSIAINLAREQGDEEVIKMIHEFKNIMNMPSDVLGDQLSLF